MSRNDNSGPPDDDSRGDNGGGPTMMIAAYGCPPPPMRNGLDYALPGTPASQIPILTIEDIETVFDEAIAELKNTTHPARHAAFDTLKEEVLRRVRKSVSDEVSRFRASRGGY